MAEPSPVTPRLPPLTLHGEGIGNFYSAPAEAAAALDRIAVPVPIADWAGPVATAEELTATYGIPGDTLGAWERDGLIIALPAGGHALYPVAQFHEGRPLRGIDEVLRMALRPRVAWDWLMRPHFQLELRPIDLLKAGDVDRVRALADEEFLQQR